MGTRTVLERLVEAGEQQSGKAPRRAVALPTLRPYLPSWRHLRRILGGLVVLVRIAVKGIRTALRAAVAPPKPKKAKQPAKPVEKATAKDDKGEEKTSGFGELLDGLERAGAAVLIVVVAGAAGGGILGALSHTLWAQVRPYAWILATVGIAGLLTAAWIVGPTKPGEKPAEKPAAGGEAPTPAPPLPHALPPLDAATVAATVRGIAVPRGWKGAHLDDVLAHLPGRSREELLATLTAAGIPVEEQLKLRLPGGRQRNRQGVRLTALPPADHQPAAPAASAPPQQPAQALPQSAPPTVPLTVFGTE